MMPYGPYSIANAWKDHRRMGCSGPVAVAVFINLSGSTALVGEGAATNNHDAKDAVGLEKTADCPCPFCVRVLFGFDKLE